MGGGRGRIRRGREVESGRRGAAQAWRERRRTEAGQRRVGVSSTRSGSAEWVSLQHGGAVQS
eukprot:3402796-Rhodomonas_salina.1